MTQPKKTIKAVSVVRDIRSGMTDTDLRKKYRLTEKGLQVVFERLLDAGLITPSDLELRSPIYAERIIGQPVRVLDRKKLDFPLVVYERDDPEVRGVVADISDRGVGIRGIDAQMGEIKTFVIDAQEFFEIDPLEFKAICRWFDGGDFSSERFGGYELIEPSDTSLKDLLDLINALSLDERTLMASNVRKTRRDSLL